MEPRPSLVLYQIAIGVSSFLRLGLNFVPLSSLLIYSQYIKKRCITKFELRFGRGAMVQGGRGSLPIGVCYTMYEACLCAEPCSKASETSLFWIRAMYEALESLCCLVVHWLASFFSSCKEYIKIF